MSTNTLETFTIGLVGQVSAGKSSFLNSLCGNIVASSSLQRETFEPTMYIFDNNITQNYENFDDLEIERDANKEKRDSGSINISSELNTKLIADKAGIFTTPKIIRVIDFPGINDAHDIDGKFMNYIEKYSIDCNLIVYVTDASTAFTLQSERECFNKIKVITNKNNDSGNLTQLVVVINKFDDKDDPDLIEITLAAKKFIVDNKVFTYSSHKQLVKQWIFKKITVKVSNKLRSELVRIIRNSDSGLVVDQDNIVRCGVKHAKNVPGDFDHFLAYVKEFSTYYEKHQRKHALETVLKYNPTKMPGSYCKINGREVYYSSELFKNNHLMLKNLIQRYKLSDELKENLSNLKQEPSYNKINLYQYITYELSLDFSEKITEKNAGMFAYMIYHNKCDTKNIKIEILIDILKYIGNDDKIDYGTGEYDVNMKNMDSSWDAIQSKKVIEKLINMSPVLKYINKLMNIDILTLKTLIVLNKIEYSKINKYEKTGRLSDTLKCLLHIDFESVFDKNRLRLAEKKNDRNGVMKWNRICDLDFFHSRIADVTFDE